MTNTRKLLTLLLVVLLAIGLSFFNQRDFVVFYTAGAKLLSGNWIALYDPSELTPYKYHPITIFLFAPFAVLPLAIAKFVWSLIWLSCLVISFRLVQKEFQPSRAGQGWSLFLVLHALTWQINLGNVTPVLLLCLVLAQQTRGRPTEWLALSFAILLKPYLGILLAVPLFQRRWQLIGKVSSVLAAATLVSWLAFGFHGTQVFELWLQTLSSPLHAHNYPKLDNQSWFAAAYRWFENDPHVFLVFYVAGCLTVGGWWFWRWRACLDSLTYDSVIPISLWLGPLTWIHSQILLFPLAMRLGQQSQNKRLLVVASICLSGVGPVPWGVSGSRLLLWCGIPLIGYLFLLQGQSMEQSVTSSRLTPTG